MSSIAESRLRLEFDNLFDSVQYNITVVYWGKYLLFSQYSCVNGWRLSGKVSECLKVGKFFSTISLSTSFWNCLTPAVKAHTASNIQLCKSSLTFTFNFNLIWSRYKLLMAICHTTWHEKRAIQATNRYRYFRRSLKICVQIPPQKILF